MGREMNAASPAPRPQLAAVAILVATAALLAACFLAGTGFASAAGKHHGHHGAKKASAGLAEPAAFLPPKGKIFNGTSDTGQTSDFREFQKRTAAHAAVLQSFESWGYLPKEALARWTDTRTRGMLSLSTSPCYGCKEVISPQSIAKGKGDGYILSLAKALTARSKPTYIRLLPEMNGFWNPYSAYHGGGELKDQAHSTKQFKLAWKRFVLIARGGERKAIDRQLHKLGMPAIKGSKSAKLPAPKVAFAWVPQTAGSPNIKGNQPQDYFPGYDYVDWVGADLYGQYPNFEGLKGLYRKFDKAPFMIGEWSSYNADDPNFVKTLFNWIEHSGRARMAVNYQGFGEGADNPYELADFPKSTHDLRLILNKRAYEPFAPENATRKGGKRKGGKGKGAKHHGPKHHHGS